MNTSKLRPELALILCALFWSTGGILVKLIDWNSFAIAGVRSILGAVTILLVYRKFPKIIVRNKDGSIDSFSTVNRIIAAVSYSATMILYVTATKLTTAANAILLQYTAPIWVILLGKFLLKERTDWIDYITVVGVFGSMILFFADGLAAGNFLGNVLALISGITFGVTTIFMRRQKVGNPADSFTFAHILTFIIAIPFFFIGDGLAENLSGSEKIISYISLLALGVFQMGCASVLYSVGIAKVAAISSVLLTMLEPIMNPVWVMIFYGEKPSLQAILGGAGILLFIFIRTYLKGRQRRKER